MITHIFHISDIHIFEKNYNNIRHSWKQLIADIVSWPNYRTHILLVITGDIFEFKTYLNSDDVHLFYELMGSLEHNQIKTIIIPGNHDYNINSKCAQDNISILLGSTINYLGAPALDVTDCRDISSVSTWKYINCYSHSGMYAIENIAFYVYSPIDKEIPVKYYGTENYVSIALLHEPIIAAQFDNNESIFTGRFTPKDLAHYDIVMLGDIHRPQFLAPNMAYAGSFVQKNRGEGLAHGYILWDIAARNGQHIWIPLKEAAVKLVAKDNKFMAPLPEIKATITYLALIYQDCSAEWIQKAAEEIRIKYQRPITQIIRYDPNKKMKIDVPNSLQVDMTKLTHNTLITDILKESKTEDAMISRVLDYHNKFLQNRQIAPTVRYYIKYLTWSNVLCYGPNNYVNFEELRGLVALTGRNKSGKSSVLDILIRILFNECERGHKDDIINKHAKSAYIKCCFRIVNEEYIIEQSWQKYSTATTYHLYKNGEDITKDTLIKTYKYIKEELGLGNYKDFVNLTTAMQNRQFIIDLDKKDLYGLLCKLMDIDMMRDIEDHVKKERDFLRRDKKAKLKELESLGTDGNSEESWEKEIHKLEEAAATHKLDKEKIEKQIQQCRDTICGLNRKIQIVDIAHDWQPPNLEVSSFPFDEAEYKKMQSELESLKFTFAVSKEKFIQYDKIRIKEIKHAAIKHNWADLFTYLKVEQGPIEKILIGLPQELIDMSKSSKLIIADLKTNLAYPDLCAIPHCDYDIDLLYRQLCKCNQSKIVPIEHPGFDSLDVLKQTLEECQIAQKNLSVYKAKKSVAYEVYKFITSTNDDAILEFAKELLDKYHTQYQSAKQLSKINITELENQINQMELYHTTLTNNDMVLHNMEIESKIKERQYYLDVQHDILQYKNEQTNKAIDHAIYIISLYNDAKYMYEYETLRESLLNMKNTIDGLKERIAKYDAVLEIKSQHALYEANMEKYKQLQLNNKYENEIAEHSALESSLSKQVSEIDAILISLHNEISTIRNLAVKYGEIRLKITEIDNALTLYETYYSCINYKTGIPSCILKQVCAVLSDQCNHILNNVTDFSVEFVFEEEIKIYTIAKGTNNTNIRLSASLGSGFQKFVLDMIIRIVLTRISNISNPNILFVDEGFGCLDKENFSSICSCLTKLKDNFDAMIVITHIPELQAYMDQTIMVTNEDGISCLKFGQLTDREYDKQENVELKQIRDSLASTQNIPNLPEAHLNAESRTIVELYKELVIEDNNRFKCICCEKEFKKRELMDSHLRAKSYKLKHNRYIEEKGTN